MISRNRRKSLNIRVSSASPRLPRTSRNVARPVPNPYHPGMKWRFFVPADTPGKGRRAGGGPGAGRGAGPGALVRGAVSPTRGAPPGGVAQPAGAPPPPRVRRASEEGAAPSFFGGGGLPTPPQAPPPGGPGGAPPARPRRGAPLLGGPPPRVVDGRERRPEGGRTAPAPGGARKQPRLFGE